MSAIFGKAFLVFSIPALITFISFRSSTRPLGQELLTITRSHPEGSGTLLQGRPLPSRSSTSMKLRWQLTGHQRHTVSAEVKFLYINFSMESNPRNVVFPPFFHHSSATSAAPIAPASPEYG